MSNTTSIGFLSVHPHKDPLNTHYSNLVKNHKATLCQNLTDVAHIMTTSSWASCLWKDGHAKSENFIQANGIVIDVDNGATLAEAERFIEAYDHVTVTTKRHQSKETPWDRFRIYLPTWEPIRTGDDYKATVEPLFRSLRADKCSKNYAHHWLPGKLYAIQETGRRITIKHYTPPAKIDPFKQMIIPGQGKALAARIMKNTDKYGGRQTSCFIAANRLREGGYNKTIALEYLKTLTDLPQSEIRHAVESAYK